MSFKITKAKLSNRLNSLRALLENATGKKRLTISPIKSDNGTLYTFGESKGVPGVSKIREKNIILLSKNLNKDISIWIGFEERWRTTQKHGHFLGCDVELFFCPSTSMIKDAKENIFQRLSRIECVSRSGDGKFPNDVSAYPHFHIEQLPFTDTQEEHKRLEQELGQQPQPLKVEEFSGEIKAPPVGNSLNSGWFSRIHFPLRADWFATRLEAGFAQSPLPHTSSPLSMDELDNWLHSLLVYLRNEFNRYLIKA